jgi:hypothetical protein
VENEEKGVGGNVTQKGVSGVMEYQDSIASVKAKNEGMGTMREH